MLRRDFLKQSVIALAMIHSPLAFKVYGQACLLDPITTLDSHIKDRIMKNRFHDDVYSDDVFLDRDLLPILKTSLNRLKRVQSIVGYGNFSLLGFDDAIKISKSYTRVGCFTKMELDFLDELFFSEASAIGFMGKKPVKNLTQKIDRKKVKKIHRTGNYLFRGKSMELYNRIKTQVGEDLVMTSGIRSVIKQFYLYLNKLNQCQGNLSRASRSVAPPGYSYHGIGDFDVGKKGYGIHNFTERFTETDIYKKLTHLGYIKFRYDFDNALGVRFEPWHIEVS